MIVEVIEGDLITRYSDDKTKMLHKVGTAEYYKGAIDLVTSPYVYEEVDDPDYIEDVESEDSDSDNE